MIKVIKKGNISENTYWQSVVYECETIKEAREWIKKQPKQYEYVVEGE